MKFELRWLWAPWRLQYIKSGGSKECIFCSKINSKSDREDLILFRGNTCFIIMNLYPYNTGHLMIAPYKHVPDLEDLNTQELCELMELMKKSIIVLKRTLNPDGFNIGANIGRIAGAGVEGHLHFHVIPRWAGDTSFITIVGETRVIPELLLDTYDKLVTHFHTRDESLEKV